MTNPSTELDASTPTPNDNDPSVDTGRPVEPTDAPVPPVPDVVVLCGSTRCMDAFTEANTQQTAAGRIVLSVGCNMKIEHPLWADPVEASELKVRLDGLHKAKIRLADWVLVVGDYVGDSTRSEIAYARSLGKPVRFVDATVAAESDGEVL